MVSNKESHVEIILNEVNVFKNAKTNSKDANEVIQMNFNGNMAQNLVPIQHFNDQHNDIENVTNEYTQSF